MTRVCVRRVGREVPRSRRLLFAVLLAVLAIPGVGARAGEAAGHGSSPAAQADPARATGLRRLRSSRLLGDPGGIRSRLQGLGVDLQLFYHQYLGARMRGGVDPARRFGSSGSYDFFALVDCQELAGLAGLDLLLHVKGQYDENLNEDVGSLGDPVDDADFDEAVYVDQLWLEQAMLDDRVRLRAGLLEMQSVFDRNAFANSEDRQFMNAFLDNDPVVPLPNGLGVTLVLSPAGWLELAMGAADADNEPRSAGFDTAFDGLDSLSGYLELALHGRIPGPWGRLPGSVRLGAFRDGRRRAVFGRSDADRGHPGGYLSIDQLAFREAADETQGLGLFARFGVADEDVSRIAWFWSAGFQYTGALPGRAADVVGLGVYQAIGSDRYRDAVDADFDRETGVELYYAAALQPWLVVTPDLQVVADPGASSAGRTAVIGMLRLRVGF